jgi:hypothetical protein
MKNIALTMARFVLPLELEAVKERRGDMTAVMQEAWYCQLAIHGSIRVDLTYKPSRSDHAPASIDRQLQQKYVADQWRDDQSHCDK